jgi:predicted GIY-YIG superfamily endonuclease
MAWVYILSDSCGRHYIGSTENLDCRFSEHCRGKVHSTRRFSGPLEVVASRELPDIRSARELERKLKAKKNAHIAIHLLSTRID